MNHYETVFISTPILSNDEYTRTVKKYTDFLKENGGEVLHQEDWGIKQLAYPIQKKTTGFYTLIEFKLDTQLIRKLETEFKRDQNIMRFLTTKFDKHAADYSVKRREKKAGTKKEEV
ncbi:MAG: 30S ribosomal protein S6 [Chitinophagales bacterium]|nr:30S ribosomal protein S6 [Chitinophagales bacterium]